MKSNAEILELRQPNQESDEVDNERLKDIEHEIRERLRSKKRKNLGDRAVAL